MFDIGIGEIILMAVVGLLVFGPDRLPRAAADAAKWMKQMRLMATGARKDLADSAGIDLNGTVDSVRSLRDLHPKRLVAGIMQDDPEPEPPRRPAAPPPAYDPDAT